MPVLRSTIWSSIQRGWHRKLTTYPWIVNTREAEGKGGGVRMGLVGGGEMINRWEELLPV